MNHGPFAYKASALPLSYEGFLYWYILLMDDFDEDVYMQEVEHERREAYQKKRWHVKLPAYLNEALRANSLNIVEEEELPQEYVEHIPREPVDTPKSLWQRFMAFFKK